MPEVEKKDEEKKNLVRVLFEAAYGQTRLWRTANGDLYIDVRDGQHWRTMPLSSGQRSLFGAWLRGIYASVTDGAVAHSRTIEETINEFIGRCLMTKNPVRESLRVGWGPGGSICLDLCDGEGSVVEITKEGWRIITDTSVRFIKGQGMLPLPRPVKGGKLPEEIAPLLHTRSEEDACLIAGWLLGTLRPSGPYPVLLVTGEQGSAKSSTLRLLRKIIDPHALDLAAPPKSSRDFASFVRHNFVTAIDNLSYLPGWLSDDLCRLATGTGAIGGRALYTDSDLSAFIACRPIALNGIPDFVERGDLMDRAIHIDLPKIETKGRKNESDYWGLVDQALPRMLGSLLDGAVEALNKWDTTILTEAPRMADFARWVVASEGAWTRPGVFLNAYALNRERAIASLMEFSQVGQAVIRFMDQKLVFHGSYNELFAQLPLYYASGTKVPQTSQALAAELRRVAPMLRASGISYILNGSQKGKTLLELTKLV